MPPASADETGSGLYVFDSSSLIQLERGGNLLVLTKLAERTIVPQRVAREVNQPRTPLERWLRENPRSVTPFLPQEGSLYLALLRQPEIHDGEAAAIAIALHREATLVTDDVPARRKAAGRAVPCVGTQEFLAKPLL